MIPKPFSPESGFITEFKRTAEQVILHSPYLNKAVISEPAVLLYACLNLRLTGTSAESIEKNVESGLHRAADRAFSPSRVFKDMKLTGEIFTEDFGINGTEVLSRFRNRLVPGRYRIFGSDPDNRNRFFISETVSAAFKCSLSVH